MVFWNIIRSHRKDRDTVYLMRKAFSPFIFPDFHCQRPKPDPLFPYIRHLSIRIQGHLYRIKRLSAITIRPPEHRILYADFFWRIHIAFYGSVRGRNFHRIGSVQFGFFFYLKLKDDFLFKMFLPDVNTVQPCALYPGQGHIPIDPRVRQMCPPVPSKHTVGFTDMDKTIHCVFRAHGPAFGKLFFYKLER